MNTEFAAPTEILAPDKERVFGAAELATLMMAVEGPSTPQSLIASGLDPKFFGDTARAAGLSSLVARGWYQLRQQGESAQLVPTSDALAIGVAASRAQAWVQISAMQDRDTTLSTYVVTRALDLDLVAAEGALETWRVDAVDEQEGVVGFISGVLDNLLDEYAEGALFIRIMRAGVDDAHTLYVRTHPSSATDGDGERCYQIAESKHITDDLQVVDAVYTEDDLEERLDDLTALDDAE